jgi:hypothetical protein
VIGADVRARAYSGYGEFLADQAVIDRQHRPGQVGWPGGQQPKALAGIPQVGVAHQPLIVGRPGRRIEVADEEFGRWHRFHELCGRQELCVPLAKRTAAVQRGGG